MRAVMHRPGLVDRHFLYFVRGPAAKYRLVESVLAR